MWAGRIRISLVLIWLATLSTWQLSLSSAHKSDKDEFIYGTFPSYFRWGIGTSSYQIEGAWDKDGKGENIWDRFSHANNPSLIKDGSNGDVACDSYRNYEKDVQLIKNTGVDFYRFSISWARILPTGTTESINQAGIDYYNNLINLLVTNKITPAISIHHWDLPQALQDKGGWLNEEIIEHFANFAQLLYKNFGDRVKQWFTFNEAWVICVLGHGDGIFAPGIKEMSESPYICTHNILKSHATAYRIYEREFKQEQKGQVGITIDSAWLEPADRNNPADIEASERALQFKFGLLANPIIFGQYPEIVRKLVDERSKQEGRETSRLPSFDKYWADKIKGSYDFIGVNHYTSFLVTSAKSDPGPGWYGDQNADTFHDPNWTESGSDWLRVVPWGFRNVLNWIKDTYNNPPVVVTENGYSDLPGVRLNDQGRIQYYTGYINNLLKAVLMDGCNVRAYSCWSLMDDFEWASGYAFGLHWVNFTDPRRERVPKESVKHLRQIFLRNGFPQRKLPWEEGNADIVCSAAKETNSIQKDVTTSCGCGG